MKIRNNNLIGGDYDERCINKEAKGRTCNGYF